MGGDQCQSGILLPFIRTNQPTSKPLGASGAGPIDMDPIELKEFSTLNQQERRRSARAIARLITRSISAYDDFENPYSALSNA